MAALSSLRHPPLRPRQAVNESVVTEYIIRMLGLEVCADTKVGNQMIRGISGGQKKRVTSGEMLVSAKRARPHLTPHPLALFLVPDSALLHTICADPGAGKAFRTSSHGAIWVILLGSYADAMS